MVAPRSQGGRGIVVDVSSGTVIGGPSMRPSGSLPAMVSVPSGQPGKGRSGGVIGVQSDIFGRQVAGPEPDRAGASGEAQEDVGLAVRPQFPGDCLGVEGQGDAFGVEGN